MISWIFLLLSFDNVAIIHRAQTKHLSLHILYVLGKVVCLCDILRFLCTLCCVVKIKHLLQSCIFTCLTAFAHIG